MRTQQFFGSAALLSCTIFLIVSSPAKTEAKEWVILRDNLPEDLVRVTVKLTFTHSDSSFYSASSSNIKSIPIEESRRQEDYEQRIDLGRAIDGSRYEVLLKEADDVNIISENTEGMCMARILRTTGQDKAEVLREGLVRLQRELVIPLKVPAEQIGVPTPNPVQGRMQISIYRNNPPVFECRTSTLLNGTLSGSTSTDTALLNAAITCRESLALADRYLTLSLKPFDNRPPVSGSGKVGDVLMLGAAKVVVEKITDDCSSLVLAVLDGVMEPPVKKAAQSPAAVGKPFPAFARVELVKRQLLTLEDLLSQAGADGYVALVFGDFKQAMSMPGYYGPPQPRTLSLDETMIANILKRDCEKPVVLAFVCRQLSLTDLYEKWLGRDPEFYVLSDFSNPMDVLFSSGPEPHRYPRPEQTETLAGSLNFENDKVVTALLDGTGKLVCLDTDAAGTLSAVLVEMNTAIRQGKTAPTPQP